METAKLPKCNKISIQQDMVIRYLVRFEAGAKLQDSKSSSELINAKRKCRCRCRKEKTSSKTLPREFLSLLEGTRDKYGLKKYSSRISQTKRERQCRKPLQERLQQSYPTRSVKCPTICLCKAVPQKTITNIIRKVPPQPMHASKRKKSKSKKLFILTTVTEDAKFEEKLQSEEKSHIEDQADIEEQSQVEAQLPIEVKIESECDTSSETSFSCSVDNDEKLIVPKEELINNANVNNNHGRFSSILYRCFCFVKRNKRKKERKKEKRLSLSKVLQINISCVNINQNNKYCSGQKEMSNSNEEKYLQSESMKESEEGGGCVCITNKKSKTKVMNKSELNINELISHSKKEHHYCCRKTIIDNELRILYEQIPKNGKCFCKTKSEENL